MENLLKVLGELNNYNDKIKFINKHKKFITLDFVKCLYYHSELFWECEEYSLALELCHLSNWILSKVIKDDILKFYFLYLEIKIISSREDKVLIYNKLLKLKDFCQPLPDEFKGNFLIDIGMTFQENSFLNESFECFFKAKDIFFQSNDLYGITVALTNMGVNCIERNDLDSSRKYFEEVLNLTKENKKYIEILINVFIGLGYYHDLKEEYDIAIDFYSKALSLCNEIPDKFKKSHILYNLGLINKKNNGEEAFNLYKECYEILKEIDLFSAESNYFFYKGMVCKEADFWQGVTCNWSQSLGAMEKAGRFKNKKIIEYYLGKEYDFTSNNKVLKSDAFFYNYSYRGTREFSLAPYKYNWTLNSEDLVEKIRTFKFSSPGGDYKILINCIKNLAQFYLSENRLKSSLDAFKEALSCEWKHGDYKLIDILEGLGKTYRKLNNKKALLFYSEAAHRSIYTNKNQDFDKQEAWIYLFLDQPEFSFLLWEKEKNNWKPDLENSTRLSRLYKTVIFNKRDIEH